MGALEGIRVLDLSRVIAGPFCTMILADHGADVIKVEEPGRGDEAREFGPWVNGESCFFMPFNRNKRSITADLRSEAGRRLLDRLARTVDVLVHNYRPQFTERIGLSYEAVAELNPRLVYCEITGFGREGPLADRPAYDLLVAGIGGLMSVTGEPGGPPQRPGNSSVDHFAGLTAACGVLLALQARERTGRGQRVEVSMLDSLLAVQGINVTSWAQTGTVPRPGSHNQNVSVVPYGTFRTADGYINVGATNQKYWRALCTAIDRPGWVEDPRFATPPLRTRHRDQLLSQLDRLFTTDTSAAWLARLEAAGVPCGANHTIPEIAGHPQVAINRSLVRIDHPAVGELTMVAPPVRLSDTPAQVRTPPPRLGQDTDAVIAELATPPGGESPGRDADPGSSQPDPQKKRP